MTLRGYDQAAVDAVIAKARAALTSGDASARSAARVEIEAASIPVVFRGYDPRQVLDALEALAA